MGVFVVLALAAATGLLYAVAGPIRARMEIIDLQTRAKRLRDEHLKRIRAAQEATDDGLGDFTYVDMVDEPAKKAA